MATGPGGRWISRIAKTPKSPTAIAPTIQQTTMCSSTGLSFIRRRSRNSHTMATRMARTSTPTSVPVVLTLETECVGSARGRSPKNTERS